MRKLFNVFLLALFFQTIAAADISVKELLSKYSETANMFHTSYITKSKTDVTMDRQYSGKWSNLSGYTETHALQEFRTDGKRMKRISQTWGKHDGPGNDDEIRPESEMSYGSDTYDGKLRYAYGRTYDNNGRVSIYRDEPEKSFDLDGYLAYSDHISECFGYFHGDLNRFDRILSEESTSQVTLRDEMEDINGAAHYVIDAINEHGHYTVWLNPEKGCNFTKAVLIKKHGDAIRGKGLDPGSTMVFQIENTKFDNIDGVWVPVEGNSKLEFQLSNGDFNKVNKHLVLNSIVINPDHDKLGSFLVNDIKDGARVLFIGAGALGRFIWKDGEVVADVDKDIVKELDKMAAMVMKDINDPKAKTDSFMDPNSPVSLSITVGDLLKYYAKTMENYANFSENAQVIRTDIINDKLQDDRKESLDYKAQGDKRRLNKFLLGKNEDFGEIDILDKADFLSLLWDGELLVRSRRVRGVTEGLTDTIETKDGVAKIMKEHPGSVMLGYYPKENQRIDAIISSCAKATIADKVEVVDGIPCYMVSAESKKGKKYRVWFAFEHDYNIVRAQYLSGASDNGISFLLSNVRLEQVEGLWVPLQAKAQEAVARPNISKTEMYDYKRLEIEFNPEFTENDFNMLDMKKNLP